MRTGLVVAGAIAVVLLVWALGSRSGGVAEPVGLAPIAILPSGDTEAPAPPAPPPAPPAPPPSTAPAPAELPSPETAAPAPEAAPAPFLTSPPASPPVLLLLDAAAAMDAPFGDATRLDAARVALQQVVAGAPIDLPLGLVSAGDGGDASSGGRSESCSTVTTIARLGDLAAATAPASAAALSATGWRPLAAGIQVVLPVLDSAAADAAEPARLVLVASGADTCDRDPAVEVADQLADRGGRVVVDVIGLGVGGADRERLTALAAAGGGRYVDTGDQATLAAALDALIRGA